MSSEDEFTGGELNLVKQVMLSKDVHHNNLETISSGVTEKADRVGDDIEPNRVNGGEIWSGVDPANVKSYGAVGDGTANDISPIESAISNSNGTVLLPNGEYNIDGTIDIDVTTPIRFVGLGGSTILNGNGTNSVFTVTNAPSIEFRHLTIENADRGILVNSENIHNRFIISNCHIDTTRYGINSGNGSSYGNVIIENSEFTNMSRAISLREQTINNGTIENNTFTDLGRRAIIMGNSERDGDGISITNNSIRNITSDSGEHVIGILCYSNDSTIEGNYLRNITSNDRHEGIASRGRRSKITNNTLIDSGGSTAAISLAGDGPTKISNNDIVFTGEYSGLRRAMDCRQREVNIHNNTMRGWKRGIYLRRGARCNIHNNRLYETDYADVGIDISISAERIFDQAGMRNINIESNQFAEITGPGNIKCIHINPNFHDGENIARLDDVIVTDNIFNYVGTDDTAIGVQFNNVGSDPAKTRRAIVTNNIFSSSLDVPISEDGIVEDKIFKDNIGT